MYAFESIATDLQQMSLQCGQLPNLCDLSIDNCSAILYVQLGSYGLDNYIPSGRALGVEGMKNNFERVDGGKIDVTRKPFQVSE